MTKVRCALGEKLKGRRIALWGLAFKAGTDDIRDSPAMRLARWLHEHDAVVRGYDPAASARASEALPGLVIHDTAMDALTGADVVVISTEWPEFRDLDWSEARSRMAGDVVIDGRRLLDPTAMRDLGFRYERVGSPTSGAFAARR
jgi:UDPglucose 6-dehydrogenase